MASYAYPEREIAEGKGLAILAYVGVLINVLGGYFAGSTVALTGLVLVLFPLFMAKDNGFVRFNVNQALVTILLNIAIIVVFALIVKIVNVIPVYFVRQILGIVFGILELGCYVPSVLLAAFGIVNTTKGVAKDLPVIGKIKLFR